MSTMKDMKESTAINLMDYINLIMSDQLKQLGVEKGEKEMVGEEEKDEKKQTEEQIVQVVDTKPQHIISNKQEILKIFENMDDDQNYDNLPQPVIKNKKSFRKKDFEKKKSKADQQKITMEEKRQKIQKLIEPSLKKYKATNAPVYHDSELNKLKFEGKEKIFKYMLYNIYELKDLDPKNLSEEERQLIDFNTIDAYNFAKSIANEISAHFINSLNSNNRNSVSKKFKTQWKRVISNIQDESNFEFRTKIATRKWTAEKLAEADEIQFYPQAKREVIEQRNKRLLNAATVEEKFINPVPEEESMEAKIVEMPVKVSETQLKKKESYKYLEEGSWTMLNEFLGDTHILKMKTMIEKDIRQNSRLLESINEVFNL